MGNENEMENVIDNAVMGADVNEFRCVRARSDRVGERPLLRSSGGPGRGWGFDPNPSGLVGPSNSNADPIFSLSVI